MCPGGLPTVHYAFGVFLLPCDLALVCCDFAFVCHNGPPTVALFAPMLLPRNHRMHIVAFPARVLLQDRLLAGSSDGGSFEWLVA
jgi:hypothetical protein